MWKIQQCINLLLLQEVANRGLNLLFSGDFLGLLFWIVNGGKQLLWNAMGSKHGSYTGP